MYEKFRMTTNLKWNRCTTLRLGWTKMFGKRAMRVCVRRPIIKYNKDSVHSTVVEHHQPLSTYLPSLSFRHILCSLKTQIAFSTLRWPFLCDHTFKSTTPNQKITLSFQWLRRLSLRLRFHRWILTHRLLFLLSLRALSPPSNSSFHFVGFESETWSSPPYLHQIDPLLAL